MDFDYNCPQYVNFDQIPVADDSWFKRQAENTGDKFLRTVDLNKVANPPRREGNGSYCEIADDQKSPRRKSHPMRTRQDARCSNADEHENQETSGKGIENSQSHKTQGAVAKSMQSTKNVVSESYESMAEKVVKFFQKTPDRFKKSKKNQPVSGSMQSIPNTRPITPRFETNKRIRGTVNVKSSEERELEELEAMKAAQFKAHPINPRLLGRSASTRRPEGYCHRSKAEIAKEVVARLAKPKNPTTSSADVDERSENKVAPKRCFHPMTTAPHSPALQTKKRAIAHPDVKSTSADNANHSNDKFYHPPPNFEHTFKPKLDHKTTKAEPFSFYDRDRQRFQRKEAKIREVIKEEQRLASKFKAQLLPSESPDELPEKKTRPPTRPTEFNLESESRGSAYQRKFKHDRENSEELKRRIAQFKANSAEVLKKPPFEPVVPTRIIDCGAPPSLATETRAESRRAFEERQRAREQMLEEERKRELEENEKVEMFNALNQRKEAVHKAKQIRQYKPVEIQPCTRNITIPKSPKFSKRFKK